MMSIGTKTLSLGYVYKKMGKLNGRIVRNRGIGRASGGVTRSKSPLMKLSSYIPILRNWKFQSSGFYDVEPDFCLGAFAPLPSLCFPLPPLFCLEDLPSTFTILKEFVEIKLIPVKPREFLFAGTRRFTSALMGTPFAPGRVADVFGQLAEFGEVELKGLGIVHWNAFLMTLLASCSLRTNPQE
jgi:hypothetical protein